MSELPTGTVTLLLADVEGSTRLWETQPEAMKAAVARLDQTLSDAVATHQGVRPVEQGGQTVLSGATEPLVIDQLPPDVSLTDLGSHPLRDLPRPERVVQLCHPDLHNDFPPLRTANAVAAERLPAQLTSFIGRQAEMNGIREALADNRLVTLTGAGGAGKTRLAVQVAATIATEFADGVWYVDLAPITDPDVVPGDGGTRAGPARPTRPTDDGRTVAVHSRSPDAAIARQLRTPARRQRRADYEPAGRMPGVDIADDEPRADRRGR